MFRRHPALATAAPSALLRKLQKHLPSGTPVSSVQFSSRWYLNVGKAHNCALYAIFRKSVAAAFSQFEAVEMQVGITALGKPICALCYLSEVSCTALSQFEAVEMQVGITALGKPICALCYLSEVSCRSVVSI